ncbi:hypothetical protein ZIOFF_039592 [Zingiber officinale]|uniref:Protein kinase domain-containing protein n=1 Tax=Zingiber officinale TaxID=94328 RepID=A0A8J5G3J1_ZINOF|nr:hypothetical protein ZIOFF_039592 [Zingiber officinale]
MFVEVKILKVLSNHNNLVKFYDACEDALNVYVVMELCEGGELLERILSRGGRYSEEDAKAIVIQILSVIAFCHLQGVVHRDLKPEELSKALTEDQLFYLRSQLKPLAPNGEGLISFDNFRMALLQNATESMKESKVIDILNVARHLFLLPFFLQLLSFFFCWSDIFNSEWTNKVLWNINVSKGETGFVTDHTTLQAKFHVWFILQLRETTLLTSLLIGL